MISRSFIILLLTSALRFAAATRASGWRFTPMRAADPAIVVRAVFNEGVATTHKHCTATEFQQLVDAIDTLSATLLRRNLRTGRKLPGGNCENLCCDENGAIYAGTCLIAGCTNFYEHHCDEDDDFTMRRGLSESNIIVLDDFFYDEDNNDRSLAETYISVSECNALKKEFYKTILDTVDGVCEDCASLLLAPNVMQCLAIVEE